ncbi:MAG: DNA polymerase III subunit delta [Ruminococcus sp.]|nr:DNA polymerase III subunit delta [Candidatus Copronaster equi]
MPALNESELKKQIKSKNFSNLYLLYGDEKYLVKHYTSLLTDKIISPDFADFNFHSYEGKNIDFDEVYTACEALPMFDSYTCILIKDLPLDSLNAESGEKLIKIISDISETTVIIISLLTVDDSLKSAKGKKYLKEIEKYGSSIEFTKADFQKLVKLIEKGAQSRNCEFSYREAEYLLSMIGNEMTVVLNELEKICAYKKSGKIEKSDIDAVVVKNLQARVFDLTKALAAGDCDTAMETLNTLIYMKEEPINILAVMITNYVDMYRAYVYSSGGLRAEDAAKDFNYKGKEFRLKNASRSISKYSVYQLRKFLELLNEADLKLKSTSISGKLILEETITKLFLVSNGEKI